VKSRPRSTGTSYERPFTAEQRDWLRFPEKYQRDNHILFMHKTDWLEAAKLFLRVNETTTGDKKRYEVVGEPTVIYRATEVGRE
jgi:hypothetical protein